MNHPYRWKIIFPVILLSAILVMLIINIIFGSVDIPIAKIGSAIFNVSGPKDIDFNIIWKIRLPRSLAAILGGAALSLSGLLLQVLFRNPLADPFILGISSGASLFAGLVIFLGALIGWTVISPFLLMIAAFIGAMLVMVLVLAIARKIKNIVTLLIVGIMVGYLCSALTNLMVAFAQKEQLHLFMIWNLGSFSGISWPAVIILGGATIFLSGAAFLICKPLNALLFGEDYARSMGVDIKRLRFLIILIACLLSAIITAFAGPIAFIGLAVPYMARLACKTSDNRMLVPITALLGGLLASLCDLAARMLFAPLELPISVITSFFGVPLVIGLLLRRNRSL
ncbi:MAG TPA: iron ABC transporter permease [Firmicutes bacterium]|jgi:iron complex transport system permease protein|nr:iron ABC transporter permease [Bacillota bacterium]